MEVSPTPLAVKAAVLDGGSAVRSARRRVQGVPRESACDRWNLALRPVWPAELCGASGRTVESAGVSLCAVAWFDGRGQAGGKTRHTGPALGVSRRRVSPAESWP
ncbi:Os10g0449525 [Oryza sativa Japonica Group]|uniref:Uncharacterized protein n=2 Tax=Oryza sativa subsp. japonica TaxID=39947 RepID=A0A8J8Y392_ORYSJ|nr:hypothetical protein OsJ_31719 [Oryza sativa Japonica Group]BAT11093.1 Os10g0449525 [Oryza sativa Japonica Group]